MRAIFEWTTEQLRYGLVRHRCMFLGLCVGRIVTVAGEKTYDCESYVEFVSPFKTDDLDAAKRLIQAETVRWFEAAATACGEKPYRAEDHPDLFPTYGDKQPDATAPATPTAAG